LDVRAGKFPVFLLARGERLFEVRNPGVINSGAVLQLPVYLSKPLFQPHHVLRLDLLLAQKTLALEPQHLHKPTAQ
jgi:hypothetical protein